MNPMCIIYIYICMCQHVHTAYACMRACISYTREALGSHWRVASMDMHSYGLFVKIFVDSLSYESSNLLCAEVEFDPNRRQDPSRYWVVCMWKLCCAGGDTWTNQNQPTLRIYNPNYLVLTCFDPLWTALLIGYICMCSGWKRMKPGSLCRVEHDGPVQENKEHRTYCSRKSGDNNEKHIKPNHLNWWQPILQITGQVAATKHLFVWWSQSYWQLPQWIPWWDTDRDGRVASEGG